MGIKADFLGFFLPNMNGGGGVSLGETSTTAYRGDRGKIAYDHSQLISGNPHNVNKTDVGLANVQNVDTTQTQNITQTDALTLTNSQIAQGENQSIINGKLQAQINASSPGVLVQGELAITDNSSIPTSFGDIPNTAFTLSEAGTWDVTYILLCQRATTNQTVTAGIYNSANVLVANSVASGTSPNTANGTFIIAQTVRITTTGSTVYKLRGVSAGALTAIRNNGSATINTANSKILFRKIGGGTPFVLTTPLVTRFTASGVWTPQTNMTYAIIEAVGAGGGGGTAVSTLATYPTVSGGGGSGAYVKILVNRAQVPNAVAITVPLAATGGNSGTPAIVPGFCQAGGGSSFGSFNATISQLVSTGGAGGTFSITLGQNLGSKNGMKGADGVVTSVNNNVNSSGKGGDSHFGCGAPSVNGGSASVSPAPVPSGFGGGGGGAIARNATVVGGASGAGLVIITEYFN